MLEPERFAGQYRIWEKRSESGRVSPRNGKVWDAFEAQAAADRVEVLTIDEADEALRIAEAVRGDPEAMKYLETGDPEVTLQADMQGRPCKGRVDWLTSYRDTPVLVGLKSSRDCRPFSWQAGRPVGLSHDLVLVPESVPGHHRQEAEGHRNRGRERASLRRGCVPRARRCAASGRGGLLALLPLFAECERTGVWPGASPRESDISLPSWVYQPADDVSELGLEGFA